MSQPHQSAPHPGAAAHGHSEPGHEVSHGSFRDYLTGFVLSVILTAIPFWIVMGGVFENSRLAGLVIMAFAAVQIVVHMVYFLHMNTRSEGGWNMLALLFTIVIVGIAIAGSLWVMYHMNTNMMPAMDHGMNLPSPE